jgi:hypothetical protein
MKIKLEAGTAQSVQQLATGWAVLGSNPGSGNRYSLLHIRPDRPYAPPSLLCRGYRGSFPRVERPMKALTIHHYLALTLKMSNSLFVP